MCILGIMDPAGYRLTGVWGRPYLRGWQIGWLGQQAVGERSSVG